MGVSPSCRQGASQSVRGLFIMSCGPPAEATAVTYPVFGVDVSSAVDEMLSTLAVSRPDGDVQRRAAKLRGGVRG